MANPSRGTVGRVLDDSYGRLVKAGLAPAAVPRERIKEVHTANIVDGRVAGFPAGTLNTEPAREAVHDALAEAGLVPPVLTEAEPQPAIGAHAFWKANAEPEFTAAAEAALAAIIRSVGLIQTADLAPDALSRPSRLPSPSASWA